jgi:catechol 2,3-dioxygenase-like lactoylglutathione lyase family enzyme
VIEINGMAHVILTVNRFDLARAFYGRLLPEFGMKPVYDSDNFFYCVGARTAIGIRPCNPTLATSCSRACSATFRPNSSFGRTSVTGA